MCNGCTVSPLSGANLILFPLSVTPRNNKWGSVKRLGYLFYSFKGSLVRGSNQQSNEEIKELTKQARSQAINSFSILSEQQKELKASSHRVYLVAKGV
tara:strand:+ start:629 stop:922 length:294 start_codon:yes stop_codon:yes gene_type:complete